MAYGTAYIHSGGTDKKGCTLFRLPAAVLDVMAGLFFFMDSYAEATIDYSGKGAMAQVIGTPIIDPVAGGFMSFGAGMGIQTNIRDMAYESIFLVLRTAATGLDAATRPTLLTTTRTGARSQLDTGDPATFPADGTSISVGAANLISLSGRRHFDPATAANSSAVGVNLATNLSTMKGLMLRQNNLLSTIWDMTLSKLAPSVGQPGYAAPNRPIRAPNDQFFRIGTSYGTPGATEGPSDIMAVAFLKGYVTDSIALALLDAVAVEAAYRGHMIKAAA